MTDEQMRSVIKTFLRFAALPGPEYVLKYGEFERSGIGPPNWEKWVERPVTEEELDETITEWLIYRKEETDE